jgi:hypothetical protein
MNTDQLARAQTIIRDARRERDTYFRPYIVEVLSAWDSEEAQSDAIGQLPTTSSPNPTQ